MNYRPGYDNITQETQALANYEHEQAWHRRAECGGYPLLAPYEGGEVVTVGQREYRRRKMAFIGDSM